MNFISVIVICFNEEMYLERCLLALLEQDYPRNNFEIILIDNGSTDGSVEIGRKYSDVLEVHSKRKVGALRNIGVQLAKGPIVAFLDGDCEASAGWLRTINDLSLKYPNTVNGAECYIDSTKPWVARAWFCTNKTGRSKTVSLGASNFFMSKHIFVEMGGFDENLTTGEDAELFCRINKKYPVMYDSSLLAIHHGVPLSIKSFFKREMWHGLGALGSFKVDPFDKPLIVTVAFSLSCLLWIFGLFYFLISGSVSLFLLGMLSCFFLVILTLLYRRGYIRSNTHAWQLAVLFTLFYVARSISLVKLGLGFNHSYYRRDRD